MERDVREIKGVSSGSLKYSSLEKYLVSLIVGLLDKHAMELYLAPPWLYFQQINFSTGIRSTRLTSFFQQHNPIMAIYILYEVIKALPPPTEATMHEAAPATWINYQP